MRGWSSPSTTFPMVKSTGYPISVSFIGAIVAWKNRSNFAKVKLIRLPLAQSRWRDCPPKSVLVVLALTSRPSDGEPIKANLPKELTPADLDVQRVETLLRQKTEGPDQLGTHPETDEPIYLLTGAYGPYVQLGAATEEKPKPKRASLPRV
nr:hypothetical protein 150 - Synechococcus sp [Synechococcus sp.]